MAKNHAPEPKPHAAIQQLCSSHAQARAAAARQAAIQASIMQQTKQQQQLRCGQHARRRKRAYRRILAEGKSAEGKNRAVKAALHTFDFLPITLNPDRISQNVQHKNCRGEANIKLHKRKRRKCTSRF